MGIKLNPVGKILLNIDDTVEMTTGVKHKVVKCTTASCYSVCSLRLLDSCDAFACNAHERPDRTKIQFTNL